MSVRAFCAREGVTEAAFYFWRSEIQRRDGRAAPTAGPRLAAPAFVELRAIAAAAPEAPLELRLPGDRRLLIRPGCDSSLLGQVLSTLDALNCSKEGQSC